MPELPEVEHCARQLRRWLEGHIIERAEADPTRLLRGKTTPRSFAKALSGRTVVNVQRRGKHLLLQLDDDRCLLAHLGMSGKWVRRSAADPAPRSSRARLFLSDSSVLHDVDPRMFGVLMIVPKDKLAKLPELRDLGPDPLTDRVDADVLRAVFGTSRSPIKVLLMDSSVIAGLGNIQATEALFRARIHPARPASSLTQEELTRLAKGITASIRHTLAAQGPDEEIVYLSERRGASNPFLAYGRAREPCPRCKTPLLSVTLGGRTTVYCPRCQPLSPPLPHRERGSGGEASGGQATRSAPRRARG
ncbi:MAG: bifunctional DNA-formamidopyrimidine glycosylase/DNA-(apurinic or apyrimidinic site) lyase [Polyangiaceae bacterium]|nr:bifunctional DNA-formamidopyrimidine glycosylase/DNA-(apurinic or apyrimidinic site) lyase [Polyangiaceae bacterium]